MKPRLGPFDPAFESLWRDFPSKIGKKAAFAHFEATVKTLADVDAIKRALANYTSSDRVKRGFVQNGSTWFNNWRDWVDYVEPQKGRRAVEGHDYEGTDR